MSVHPKNTSETKCDWLVVAMHATAGSRNAEFGMIKNIASERAETIRTK